MILFRNHKALLNQKIHNIYQVVYMIKFIKIAQIKYNRKIVKSILKVLKITLNLTNNIVKT